MAGQSDIVVTSREETMPQDDARLLVRLPQDLKAALEQIAKGNDRSLNREVVRALRKHAKTCGYEMADE